MSEPTSQTSWAIETFDLSHTYGELTALNRLNLQVGRGDIFGFIGSNGAGKTTALKILSLFLRPASGTASIYGYDIHHQGDEIRRLIGYMPDTFGVYKDMLVVEYLDFFGACYQMKRSDRAKKLRKFSNWSAFPRSATPWLLISAAVCSSASAWLESSSMIRTSSSWMNRPAAWTPEHASK
jgi:ABC-2 type transport system ATP-binding protein